jgi:sulfite exporter TauE/SafE
MPMHMMHGASLWPALVLTGLLGSLAHCTGMCGPLVLLVAARFGKDASGRRRLGLQLLYHTCRICVYGVLGLAAGALGGLLGNGSGLAGAEAWVSIGLGAAVVVAGAGYLGLRTFGRPLPAVPGLDRGLRAALARPGAAGVAGLGCLNGVLPCGLVYSALLVAAGTGEAATGAAGMLLFGAATMPVLLVIGSFGQVVPLAARARLQTVAGVFIVLVGAQLVLRGAAALHVLPQASLWDFRLW